MKTKLILDKNAFISEDIIRLDNLYRRHTVILPMLFTLIGFIWSYKICAVADGVFTCRRSPDGSVLLALGTESKRQDDPAN